jgi:hypothetical protein
MTSYQHIRIALLAGILLFSGACSSNWVQLTPEANQVSVATPAEVTACTRVGSANVSAADSIGFVQRSARQLQEDLIRLARNEAGNMQANRIVTESPINDGRQTFGVYRCP